MKYLRVSDDDDEFIDLCCDKLHILLNSDGFVRNGLKFRQLLDVLMEVGFMAGFELHEREMFSVHSAQLCTDILISAGVFGESNKSRARREKISRLVPDCCEIANENGPFKDRRFYQETKLLVYKF